MAKKNILLKAVAIGVIFAPAALLCLGLGYDILSRRAGGIGLLAWMGVLLLLPIFWKRGAKNDLGPSAAPGIAIDDRARKQILRGIWISRVWIGLLVVSLPIGTAEGAAHRAWLPTLGGVAINLSLMYMAIQEIKQRRKQLSLNRGGPR
ncbi:MAG: hypothetical protein ACLP1Y_16755 [Candidatus Acidiferrales bacterium]